MKPRSFFNIVIKILGIFFLVQSFAILPDIFSSFMYYVYDGFTIDGLAVVSSSIIILILYIVLVIYLMFKTNYLIDKLKLDQGFNEEVLSINIDRSSTLLTALVITAGVILLNEIPNFCRAIYLYFRDRQLIYSETEVDYSYALVSLAKIVIALLLIGERKRIVHFFDKSIFLTEDQDTDMS